MELMTGRSDRKVCCGITDVCLHGHRNGNRGSLSCMGHEDTEKTLCKMRSEGRQAVKVLLP
jgi:hypothetical protein